MQKSKFIYIGTVTIGTCNSVHAAILWSDMGVPNVVSRPVRLSSVKTEGETTIMKYLPDL